MTVERIDGPAGHLYRAEPDAPLVAGVTTILAETVPDPAQLARWRRRQDVECAVDTVLAAVAADGDALAAGLRPDGEPIDRPSWTGDILDAADARADATRDAGSAAHTMIAAHLCGDGDGDAEGHALAAARAVEWIGLDWWACEVPGIRPGLYGGTIDLVGVDGVGCVHVIDWKTTADGGFLAAARRRECLQVAAYCGLHTECLQAELQPLGPVVQGRMAVRGWVARLGADGTACVCGVDVAEMWQDWWRLLALRRSAMLSDGVLSTRRLS